MPGRVPAPLFHRVARDVADHQRPGTDEAHFAAKDVDELGKLVEPGPAHESREPGDGRPGRHLDSAAGLRPAATGRRPHLHRPELQDRERHPVATGSDLTKEHRRTHREADSDRDPGENRPEPQERHGRPEPIEGNLGRSADAGATPT